jgi:group II intron reverse transcriptase/maturase
MSAQESAKMRVYYSLYDRLLSAQALSLAFKKVKSANGAPGIDGQSVSDFAEQRETHVSQLIEELSKKSYRPKPVRRVTIPKDGGGERKLGIPCVRDRVVQQALLDVLQPIFDPDFHPSSYAYRPKRGCHHAIAKVTEFARRHELEWAVDMDLSKCFDLLDHELIIQAFRKRIADGSILNLLTLFLESGVLENGVFEESTVGSPQGGVISPLVANVYLDAFDQEMKSRGHRIVRYADDIVILKRSKSAAENVLHQATTYLEQTLRLKVNKEKTKIVTLSEGIPYLGVVIFTQWTTVQPKRIVKLKDKIRLITRRNSPVNLEKVISELNPVLRGFAHYFKVANCNQLLAKLSKWTRRRLRSKQLALWKKPKRLLRRLRQLGYKDRTVATSMFSWSGSNSEPAKRALPNTEFDKLGLFSLTSIKSGILPQEY